MKDVIQFTHFSLYVVFSGSEGVMEASAKTTVLTEFIVIVKNLKTYIQVQNKLELSRQCNTILV